MCSRRARRILLGGFLLLTLLLVVAAIIAYRFVGPSPACKRPATAPAQPGVSAWTIESGGRERCYLLYLPTNLDPAEPAPLLVGLHGFASNGAAQTKLARWKQLADDEGFVVAYPDGTAPPLRWNVVDAFQIPEVDDVQFVRDLVTDVGKLVSLDPTRIYVAGFSNGGAMASRIACEAADVVAAIGTVSAIPLDIPGGCAPSRPVPVIAFHGTADPVVQYEGGSYRFPGGLGQTKDLAFETIDYPPVETWIAAWAERNGCAMTPNVIPAIGDTSGIRYTGCQDDAKVVLYTIEDGGHIWPGTFSIPLLGKASQDIDASTEIWAFFQAHPLER